MKKIVLSLLLIFLAYTYASSQTVTLYNTVVTTAKGWTTNTSTGTSSSVTYAQNNCVFGGGSGVTINTAQTRCTYSGEIGLSGSNRWMDLPSLTFVNNPGGTSAGTLSVTWYNNGGGRAFRYYLFNAQGQQIGSATEVATSSAGTNGSCTTYDFTLPAITGAKVIKISTNGNSSILEVTVKTYNSGVPPSVTSTTASAITSSTATSGGNVTAEGDASVTARGVVWNTSASPTVALSTKTVDGSGAGSFVSSISSLTPNTKYYYNAYATSSIVTAYGTESNFTTLPADPVSSPANNISLTGFNANWAAPTQGAETFSYTLQYTTDNSFATGVTTIANVASSNTSYSLSGLSSGATYYYRVYAVNTTGSSAASSVQTVVLVDGTLAADYFRTVATGNWNAAGTWESSHDNNTWTAATSGPDNNASAIQIRNGHTVTVTATTGANALTLDAGTQLVINLGSTFTVANGTGTDITVSGTIKNIGSFTLAASAAMAVSATGVYEDAQPATTGTITIPTATWAAGSTFTLSGLVGVAGTDYANLQGVKQSFSNFRINTPNLITKLLLTRNGGTSAPYMEITGTLTIDATGTGTGVQLLSTGNNNNTLVVGKYIQNDGNVYALHNASSNASRNFTVLGDFTLDDGAVFDIANTTGTSATNITYTNIGGNLSIASTATLQRTQAAAGPNAAIIFNGTSLQSASFGLSIGQINYTVSNASGVTLLSDLTVNGVLTLTNGNLITGSNKAILSSTGSISGAGANRWIAGNLQKNVPTAAGSVTFEIGAADAYRPIVISFLAGVITGGDLTASVSQTAGDHPNISSSGLSDAKSVNRFWTLSNSGLVSADYFITFNFEATDIDAGANFTNFIVKKYNGSAWSTPGTLAKTATSTQASEGTGPAALSQFAIGESSVLPVTISTFKGEAQGAINILQWITSTETNNKGFQVERSADGRTFTGIAFVNTKAESGNSTSGLGYSFDDTKPLQGISYYRLKQIDNDGKSVTSAVVSVARKVSELSVTRMYPNPATTELTLLINAPKKEALRMIVSDISGKIVLATDLTVQTGANKQSISTSNFAPGTYMIRLVTTESGETITQTFIKQ